MSCAEGDNGFVYEGILDVRGGHHPARRDAREPDEDHAQRRNPRPGVRVLEAPQQGRRAGAPRVRHQPADRHPPPRPARLRHARPAAARRDRRADRRLRVAARLLRAARRRGRVDDRRRVRAGAGDRAAVGLQVQRVRQPHRRRAVRAARGEPDDRLPRRLPLHLGGLPRVLRHGVRGAAVRPRRDGAHERRDHGAVRPHRRRSRTPSSTCSPRTGCAAARTACASS